MERRIGQLLRGHRHQRLARHRGAARCSAVQRDRTRAPCVIYFQHARTGVTYLPHRVRRGRRPLFAPENANSFVYNHLKTRKKGNEVTRTRMKIKSIKRE